MKSLSVLQRVTRSCNRLIRWLNSPTQVAPWQMSYAFAVTQLLIERIPPDQIDTGELAYLRNRVVSSRRLSEDGEHSTSRYQIREMRNKLRTRMRK
jgi:hypothetical protein